MPRAIYLLTVLLLFTFLLSGCETIGEKKRTAKLENTLRAYESALRWSYFDLARNMALPKKDALEKPIPNLENIRVTSYEVTQPPVMVDPDTAVQMAEIRYVRKDSQVVREVRDRQIWRYDEENKRWGLDSEIPPFK